MKPTYRELHDRVFSTGIGIMVPAGLRKPAKEHKAIFITEAAAVAFASYLDEHAIPYRVKANRHDDFAVFIPKEAV